MKKRKKSIQAFSLVEVTMALGIVVLCLVTVFGLLTIGVSSAHTSIEETQASNVLSAVAADLQSTTNSTTSPGQPVTSLIYGIPIPALNTTAIKTPTTVYVSPDGATNTAANSRYQLNAWTIPGTSTNATLIHLKISWPAQANYTNAQGSVESVVALNRTQ